LQKDIQAWQELRPIRVLTDGETDTVVPVGPKREWIENMKSRRSQHSGVLSIGRGWLVGALIALTWWPGARLAGQEHTCPTPNAPPLLQPLAAPRRPGGTAALSKAVEGLSDNDAAFEVVVGQGRILSFKEDLTVGKVVPLIAIGDPTVIDFVVVSPRQIRVVGLRIGVTDLSVTAAGGKTYSFEVRVVADLEPLRAQLRCLFPSAAVALSQLGTQIIVEGQARDTAQVGQIIETIRAYMESLLLSAALRQSGTGAGGGVRAPLMPGTPGIPQPGPGGSTLPPPTPSLPGGRVTSVGGGLGGGLQLHILNLLRVPTSQQILLKVRIAELDRTALRQIGGDLLAINPATGATIGTQIGGAAVTSVATAANQLLTGVSTTAASPVTTAFGIFEEGDFALFFSALRQNQVLKILAEPNLVALNGQEASFLAGGEFPIPVPQFGAGAGAATVTVQFKEFGVRLGFLPFILDGDQIRLTVDPEVSDIDFAIATTLVPGGSPVPGLSTRRTHTTVEMRQGQTLMISGLLQMELKANTNRIPGIGDLPIIGPFFSNTSSNRVEKELVVLVTPFLIEPMNRDQVPPTPGDEVGEATDLELYFHNRIESRIGVDFRSTMAWDDPLHLRQLLHLEQKHINGPHGFAD
jgi:pilus assembly protein CpaC